MSIFREAYPELTLYEIQFAYDISKLVHLDKQRYEFLERVCRRRRVYEGAGFVLLRVFTRESAVRAQPWPTLAGYTRCERWHGPQHLLYLHCLGRLSLLPG